MCPYKSNVHHATNKDNHSNYAIIISAYVKNVSSILYIVC